MIAIGFLLEYSGQCRAQLVGMLGRDVVWTVE
jgi:hypothetical protein